MTDTTQPPLGHTFRSAENDFRVGRVFNQTFSVLSRNLLPFCIVTAIATLPRLFLAGGLTVQRTSTSASFGTYFTGGILLFIMILVLNALSQAIILYGAFEDMRGRPVDMVESLRVGLRRILPVVGTALLVGIFTMVAGFLLVIPAFIVATMLYVAIPACVVERLGPIKSAGRSANLTKGHRWKVFGLWLLIVIIAVIGQVVFGRIAMLGGWLVAQLVLLVWDALYGAFGATLAVVVYRDLRVVKEGVDTEQIASVFD